MRSEFRLTTAFRHGGTRVDGLYCTAPFKLMHRYDSRVRVLVDDAFDFLSAAASLAIPARS